MTIERHKYQYKVIDENVLGMYLTECVLELEVMACHQSNSLIIKHYYYNVLT